MKKILSILCSLFIFISCLGVNVFAKTEIPIAMALDNNYTLPTIVAMTSMLENVKDDTVYKYHLLLSKDFTEENKQKILSLKEKYQSKQFDIKFIDMKDAFKNAKKKGMLAAPTYYRLNLPSLLSTYDKCIYLDGDIIVNGDLFELWNIDLGDYYVGGVGGFFQFDCSNYAKILGIKDTDQYINAGVLLMNLKKLRSDKMDDKFGEFVKNKVNKCPDIKFQDQDTINACCYDRIKLIPLKYNSLNGGVKGGKDTLIAHFTGSSKPWVNLNSPFAKKWWDYAIKTGFYDKMPKALEIKKKIFEIKNNPKSSNTKNIQDDIYTISSKLNPNMCLNINGSSKNDKANLQLYQRNGSNAQKFKIQYNPDGSYTITAICSGMPIDVASAGKKNGTNIWQYTSNGTDAQKWFIVPDGEGYYCLISKCNNLCMDVNEAKAKNGANIHCWSIHGRDNQRFKLEKCEDMSAEVKQDAVKPGSNKPAETKKDAGKPSENKPAEVKKDAVKPSANKPAEAKKNAVKPSANKPTEAKKDAVKPSENKPAEVKKDAVKPSANKPNEAKKDTVKPNTSKPTQVSKNTVKPNSNKPGEIKKDAVKTEMKKSA